MMRQALLALRLHLLHGVIQVKIDQHSVDLGPGVLPQDLPPDQLDTPYTAGYSLSATLIVAFANTSKNLPLSCISQLLPLAISFLSLIAPSSVGL